MSSKKRIAAQRRNKVIEATCSHKDFSVVARRQSLDADHHCFFAGVVLLGRSTVKLHADYSSRSVSDHASESESTTVVFVPAATIAGLCRESRQINGAASFA